MLKLAIVGASSSLVAGWNHFASFNDGCGAELSFLRGTEFETSATLGKVPLQFKNAFEATVKARVQAEGCILTAAEYDLFYGMNAMTAVRLFDASETVLNNTAFPCNSQTNLGFNWQKVKHDMQGLNLPASCRSASFATTKTCTAKFRLLDTMFLEMKFADTCTDASQPGYGLPQLMFSCSGAMCASFARPCKVGGAACGGGATCHSLNATLADTMDFFVETGLLNNITDIAGCTSGGFNFQEKFLSDVINNVAQMLGLTTTISTEQYTTIGLCGVAEMDARFNLPTPPDQFRCSDAELLTFSQVCDGVADCANGEDEQHCNNNCNATSGFIDNGSPNYDCCPICRDQTQYYPYYCTEQYCERGYAPEPVICNQTLGAWGQTCPDLMDSTGPSNIPAAQQMTYSTTSVANEHLLGVTDCEGNVQFGNSNDMVVGNAKLPFQKMAARLESIVSAREACRNGFNAPDFKRYFYPWAVNFWGGAFFTTQSAGSVLANVNPGVKIDDSLRYYPDANMTTPLPYANVYGAPASCNAASTTGATPTCELALDVGEWFVGNFPPGWSAATTLRMKFASTCSGSALPQAMIACEGPCTSSAKSGCCLAKEPFLPANNGVCPSGYVLESLNSNITDFLFNNSLTANSKDVTLMNFVTLVATRSSSFGIGPGMTPFISAALGTTTQFCRINGSSFGTNIEAWGNRSVTANCPAPYVVGSGDGTRACPQILATGGLQGCGTNCATTPSVVTCPVSGCPLTNPLTPTPDPNANGNINSAQSAAPLGLVVLALAALF